MATDAKKIAADISEIIAVKMNSMDTDQCREVLIEIKSMCELQIMAIDDGEVD